MQSSILILDHCCGPVSRTNVHLAMQKLCRSRIQGLIFLAGPQMWEALSLVIFPQDSKVSLRRQPLLVPDCSPILALCLPGQPISCWYLVDRHKGGCWSVIRLCLCPRRVPSKVPVCTWPVTILPFRLGSLMVEVLACSCSTVGQFWGLLAVFSEEGGHPS